MRRSSLHLNKDAFENEYQKPNFEDSTEKIEISSKNYK